MCSLFESNSFSKLVRSSPGGIFTSYLDWPCLIKKMRAATLLNLIYLYKKASSLEGLSAPLLIFWLSLLYSWMFPQHALPCSFSGYGFLSDLIEYLKPRKFPRCLRKFPFPRRTFFCKCVAPACLIDWHPSILLVYNWLSCILWNSISQSDNIWQLFSNKFAISFWFFAGLIVS